MFIRIIECISDLKMHVLPVYAEHLYKSERLADLL